MGIARLRLEVPSQHDIYFNAVGDSYSRPLSGAAVLTIHPEGLAGLTQLRIYLLRVLSSADHEDLHGSEHGKFSICRLNRWFSGNPKSSAPNSMRRCSIIEELILHLPLLGAGSQVGYALEEGMIHKVPFHMPIPANIPGTSVTDLGYISYFLIASLSKADEVNFSTSQELKVSRSIIPERPLIQHARTYPNSSLVTKIIFTQNIASSTKSIISLAAKVFVRKAVPAVRSAEYKSVAVCGLRWRIEEVTRLFNQPECQDSHSPGCQPIETRSSVREILNGFQKGYWGIQQSSTADEQSSQPKDDSIDIPFRIVLAWAVAPTPAIDLGCYDSSFWPADPLPPLFQECFCSTTQQKLMLTVKHRFKFDIVTTEETFSVYDHSLVEREPPRVVRNASFPLQVIKEVEGDIQEVISYDNVPRYEQVSASPPSYEDYV